VQIVASTEDLEIVPVGNKCLSDLIYLLGFLRLATSLTEDHIGLNVEASLGIDVPLHADKTSLLSMLQIVAVTLSYLSIDSLLDPGDLINEFVSEMLHHVNGKAVLGINDPDKEEAVSLNLVERDIPDLLVIQSVIGYGHTSCRVS